MPPHLVTPTLRLRARGHDGRVRRASTLNERLAHSHHHLLTDLAVQLVNFGEEHDIPCLAPRRRVERHQLLIVLHDAVTRVHEVEQDLERLSVCHVLSQERHPVPPKSQRHLSVSHTRQVHKIELPLRRVLPIDSEVVELLCLSGSLGLEGELLPVGEHIDKRRLAHVGPPCEARLRHRLRQCLHRHGSCHELNLPHGRVGDELKRLRIWLDLRCVHSVQNDKHTPHA
mmetsp:Transcript_45627/g.111062  ORF Transcript_45627/g.111062 Transcript_45627/m.111062 type:complete len:228 (-) Transcript_45627:753-1436(-)